MEPRPRKSARHHCRANNAEGRGGNMSLGLDLKVYIHSLQGWSATTPVLKYFTKSGFCIIVNPRRVGGMISIICEVIFYQGRGALSFNLRCMQ